MNTKSQKIRCVLLLLGAEKMKMLGSAIASVLMGFIAIKVDIAERFVYALWRLVARASVGQS